VPILDPASIEVLDYTEFARFVTPKVVEVSKNYNIKIKV
jgi:hypothetical protein